MKRILALTLTLLLIMSAFATLPAGASTESVASGDYDYTLLGNGTAEITGYHGTDTEVTVPDKLDGYSVTSIGSFAFNKAESVEAIHLPPCIERICFEAFEKTAFYKNEKNWDNGALYIDHCLIKADKEKVSGEFAVREGVNVIADFAFSFCKELKKISLPNGLKRIGQSVFIDCRKLTEIDVPEGVEAIEDYAFENCTHLTSVTIPEGVEIIEDYAFYNCIRLMEVTIPKSVNVIKDRRTLGYHGGSRISGFTIKGYAGTEAHKYSDNNGYRFVDLETGKQIRIPITNGIVKKVKPVVYSGKECTPFVNIVVGKVSAQNKGTYSNNVKVGTAKVTVKGAGNYTGTIKTTFKIIPKYVALNKLVPGKKSITVKWKKNTTQTTGYQLQYSVNKSFKGASSKYIKTNKTTSEKISGLRSGKTYYVRVRAYKVVKGEKYYSVWSASKDVKTK